MSSRMYYLTDINVEEVVMSTDDGFTLCETLWSNSNINTSIFFVSYSPYGVRYFPYGGIGLFTIKVFYI